MSSKEPQQQTAMVYFAMQSGISLLTIAFSIFMMVRSTDNIQTFLPIMTSISAYWLPAPKPPTRLKNLFTNPAPTAKGLTYDIETGQHCTKITNYEGLPSKRAFQIDASESALNGTIGGRRKLPKQTSTSEPFGTLFSSPHEQNRTGHDMPPIGITLKNAED